MTRLWTLVTEGFRCYETYQRKSERVIPLFVLEPATDDETDPEPAS